MLSTTVIAFNGKMGVGKSEAIKTLNAYLAERRSTARVVLVKFAQPLYDIQNFIYSRISKDVPKTAQGEGKDRRLLQWLGTDWGRETHGVTVWVDIWEADIKGLAELNEHVSDGLASGRRLIVVTDDCRFENEAAKVKAIGGTLIKLTSDKAGERIAVTGAAHASEAGITNEHVDFVIENNGTLADYKAQLTHLFDKLRLAE